jgi:hypothetical protein
MKVRLDAAVGVAQKCADANRRSYGRAADPQAGRSREARRARRPDSVLTNARRWIAVAVSIGVIAPLWAVADEPPESLNVTYDISSCQPIPELKARPRAAISAFVRGISKHAAYTMVIPVGSASEPFVARFKVIPDAYYIEGSQRETLCTPSAGIVSVVLPGHPISVSVRLRDCCGDAIAYSYVAGLVAAQASVNIARSPVALECGASVNEASLQSLTESESFSREGNAYYAKISDTENDNVVLIATKGHSRAFIRLKLYANGSVSSTSSFKRFDVSEALFGTGQPKGLMCQA